MSQYLSLKKSIPNITFRKGLDFSIPTNTCLVIDDQMSSAVTSSEVADLFTKKIHHNNVSVILIQQNIFPQGKFGRDIRLNAQYFTIFKSPTFMSQVLHLEQSLFPHNPRFLTEAYNDATKEPYSYLFLSLHPRVDDRLRVRAGILPFEDNIVFSPTRKWPL